MRNRWAFGLGLTALLGCSVFSGDNSVGGPPSTSDPPVSDSKDGGTVTAPICGDTVCDSPPPSSCIDAHSYEEFVARCADGVCQYDSKSVSCEEPATCVDGACHDARVRLLGLSVSPGSISFDPETMQYTVTVPSDTSQVTLNASVEDPTRLSISIDGAAGVSMASVTSTVAFALQSKTRQVPVRVDSVYGTSVSYSVLFLRAGEQVSVNSALPTSKFGSSTSISSDGTTLVVGSDRETGGFATILQRNLVGIWKTAATISLDPSTPGTRFGASVSLSGDGKILAVGMPCDVSNAGGINGAEVTPTQMACSGSVRIYRMGNDGAWKQEAFIKASQPHVNDTFGDVVALSQDASTLVVGAPQDSQNARGVNAIPSDASLSSSGAAYVFRRANNGTWSQEAYLKASNANKFHYFGSSVTASNNGVVAVGATRESSDSVGVDGPQDNDKNEDSGAVYAFRRDGSGKWTQQAYIKASNSHADGLFGLSTALSADGETLAVGAPFECSNAVGVNGDGFNINAPGSGAVYVFQNNKKGSWAQVAYVKASNTGEMDRFGWSVVLSADGRTLGVGAISEASSGTGINGLQTDNSLTEAGAAYVFQYAGQSWKQVAYVKASSPAQNDYFGFSLSLSKDGKGFAVGAPNRSTNDGSVYVFAL